MMKCTTIMMGESLLDEEPIGSHFKESMGLFKEVDSEGREAYTAYWTDGRETLTCPTYDDDKNCAEWVLNHLVFRYWKNKVNKVAEDSDYDTITKHYSRKDYGE